jgi:hypothetical protein
LINLEQFQQDFSIFLKISPYVETEMTKAQFVTEQSISWTKLSF